MEQFPWPSSSSSCLHSHTDAMRNPGTLFRHLFRKCFYFFWSPFRIVPTVPYDSPGFHTALICNFFFLSVPSLPFQSTARRNKKTGSKCQKFTTAHFFHSDFPFSTTLSGAPRESEMATAYSVCWPAETNSPAVLLRAHKWTPLAAGKQHRISCFPKLKSSSQKLIASCERTLLLRLLSL